MGLLKLFGLHLGVRAGVYSHVVCPGRGRLGAREEGKWLSYLLHYLHFSYLRNEMVYRCMAIIVVLSSLSIPWMLEQPATSLMEKFAPFQHVCKKFKVFRAHVWLGSYGGGSSVAEMFVGVFSALLNHLCSRDSV